MEVEVAVPVRLQSPPKGHAMILGMPGIKKLGLEISLGKNHLFPRATGPMGFIYRLYT